MARIRTIKPEFWESETIARLTRDARLLFIAMLNAADDTGRLRWRAAFLRSFAFPYDDLTLNEVEGWMAEIVAQRLVMPYHSGGSAEDSVSTHGGLTEDSLRAHGELTDASVSTRTPCYGLIVHFDEHQHINRRSKSKYPPPDPEAVSVFMRPGGPVLTEGSVSTHGGLTEGSLRAHVRKGREGNGMDKEKTFTRAPAREAKPSKLDEAEAVLGYLNQRTGRQFRTRDPKGKPTANAKLILDRFRDGYTDEDCTRVVASRCNVWGADDKMAQHLTPTTLFRKSNFEKYLGQL